jgi:hypothetical protein
MAPSAGRGGSNLWSQMDALRPCRGGRDIVMLLLLLLLLLLLQD